MSTTRTAIPATKPNDLSDPETHTVTGVAAPSTPTAAAVYQQLRAHLAVLRLHDAAEALPAVLDAATSEGLSLTTALERLLAVEVDATEARRLAGRLRFACLPTPATLAGFDYDNAPGVDRAVCGGRLVPEGRAARADADAHGPVRPGLRGRAATQRRRAGDSCPCASDGSARHRLTRQGCPRQPRRFLWSIHGPARIRQYGGEAGGAGA